MDVDRKPEVGGQVAAHLVPGVAGIVAAHHVPVLLHEKNFGTRRIDRDAVDAVADFRVRVGDELRTQAAIDRPPGLAAVVGSKRAGGRDRDEDPVGVGGIHDDRVQAHSTGTRLPARARLMAAQAGQFLPCAAAIGRAEQGRILDAGVDHVGIRVRRLEMPDALEFPGVLRAVVPLVSSGHAVVLELVADGLPGLAAVVRAWQSSGRTNRLTATRTTGLDQPASLSRGRSPILQSAVH